jgi:hypothetical protein
MEPDLESELERLEREGNDDFHLLDAVGATAFSTEHLLEMRQQARHDLERHDRIMRLLMLIGGTSAGWVMGIFGAKLAEWFWVMVAAVIGLVLTMIVFLTGLVWMYVKLRRRGLIESDLDAIETELRRRSKWG